MFAEFFLAGDVFLVQRFAFGEVGRSGFMERLLGAAETLPQGIVMLATGRTERFPLRHEPLHRFAGGAPVGRGGEFLGLGGEPLLFRLVGVEHGGASLVELVERAPEAWPENVLGLTTGESGGLPVVHHVAGTAALALEIVGFGKLLSLDGERFLFRLAFFPLLLAFAEIGLPAFVETGAGRAESLPEGIVEFLAGSADGAQFVLHGAESLAGRFPLLGLDQRFRLDDDDLLGGDALLSLLGNRRLHRGQAGIEHGALFTRIEQTERILQHGQPVRQRNPVLGDLEVFFDGGRSNGDGREIERFRRGCFGCLLRRFG